MDRIVTVWLLALISGCGGVQTVQQYNAQDISVEALSVDAATMKINYRVPLESLYFSPGINVAMEEGKTVLTFVRCNINDQCKANSKAQFSQGLYQAELTVLNSLNLSEVYVTDEGEVVKLKALTETASE